MSENLSQFKVGDSVSVDGKVIKTGLNSSGDSILKVRTTDSNSGWWFHGTDVTLSTPKTVKIGDKVMVGDLEVEILDYIENGDVYCWNVSYPVEGEERPRLLWLPKAAFKAADAVLEPIETLSFRGKTYRLTEVTE